MIPWAWHWSPQLHFPFSGSVEQDISPDTNWFFGSIPPEAGVGRLEKEIFEVASYGRQLGLITQVLLSLVDGSRVDPAAARESLDKLQKIYGEIEDVKEKYKERKVEAAIALLEKMRRTDEEGYRRVMLHLESTPAPKGE